MFALRGGEVGLDLGVLVEFGLDVVVEALDFLEVESAGSRVQLAVDV